MLKEGMAVVLVMATDGVLHYWKNKNQVEPGVFFIENAEIRYCWGFILLKVIKEGTSGVLFF